SYSTDQDRAFSIQRYNSGGKEACERRNFKEGLLQAGDRVEIMTDKNGNPQTAINPKTKDETFTVRIRDEDISVKYYRVRSEKGVEGWISSSQLTLPKDVSPLNKEKVKPLVSDEDCPPLKSPSAEESLKGKSFPEKILEKASIDNPIRKSKSETEMDRYMCIHRHGKMDFNSFKSQLNSFKHAAKEAENAFGIPYAMVMCTMLTETRMYFIPGEGKNRSDRYLGLTQFGPELVSDLKDAIRRQPYKKMWEEYQSRNPNVQFTDRAIRLESDPHAPLAATALALRWIYEERMRDNNVNCVGCTRNREFNRKDLYMMVTGYNYTPFGLHKVGHKTPGQMLTGFPPPEETRDYMQYMESCMEQGFEKNFRETPEQMEPVNAGRRKILAKKEAQLQQLLRIPASNGKKPNQERVDQLQLEVSNLKRAIQLSLSPNYVRNIAQCDQAFPVK
ncbi:MAG: hypothetical protein ACAH59_06605, partial [Pseudobdellovibrionaceae bacterium]